MTEPASFPAAALSRLATRVVSGEVVFFIGSGFSIDSEGNSSRRLITRLLIRLLALTQVLSSRPAAVRGIVEDLRDTFDLKNKPDDDNPFRFTVDEVDRLATRYYETNDWFCVAFGTLLRLIANLEPPLDVDEVAAREEDIRLAAGQRSDKLREDVPLDPVDPRLVQWARTGDHRAAGKALFLDTMGFRSDRVMSGAPEENDPDAVLESYSGRLLPRHHVVARLAREGFCSTTITANFDLLLEGAFRLSGFAMRFPGGNSTDALSPPTYFDHFARIASPSEFFALGKGHRSAVLVKMHGCAERYKRVRQGTDDAVTEYLPSMVFTYREIQNWRQDSWAADYLRTLMRTRTVVFCGYSLQDPVIHDAFRTVYEDMARVSTVAKDILPKDALPEEDAPAFFLAPGERDQRQFHGMEVLHAASRAFGTKPAQFNAHPNYLRFHFRSDSRFPHIDEQLQWLEHDVYRTRQKQCLEAFLRRSVSGMLGKARPDAEVRGAIDAFDRLVQRERDRAAGWTDVAGRREHAAICSWTSQFHNGLLREFASVEMVQSEHGPSYRMAAMRRLPWYYPTTAAGGWVAWAVVVELALRNMIASAWAAPSTDPWEPLAMRAADCLAPTILFSPSKPEPSRGIGQAPVALTIRFCGFERQGVEPRIVGFPTRKVWWELCRKDAPWPLPSHELLTPVSGDDRTTLRMLPPDASVIWDWAAGAGAAGSARTDPARIDSARRSLGLVK